MNTLSANLLLTLPPSSSHSEEHEAALSKEKLINLCKHEPILKWMRSCDHILYQALVEILIPDVLRPVPSEYPAAGSWDVLSDKQPSGRLPLVTKISIIKADLEGFILNTSQNIVATTIFLLQHCCRWCLVAPENSHAF